MTTYTDVFTGANIYAANVSLTQLTLTADVTLFWPEEAQPNDPVVSKIIQIDSADEAERVITMPSALSASVGETVLFNNLSAYTVIVKDAAGTQIVSVDAGLQWQIYLDDNSTLAGGWKVYQFGAGASTANASALAGSGLTAISSKLAQSVPTDSFTDSFVAEIADRAKFFNWIGAGAGKSVTIPAAGDVGANWFIWLRNSGDSSFTVLPTGSNEIDGLTSLVMQPGDSAMLACDGFDFYTVGLGQDPVFAFNYVVIDVSGGTDYVLTGSELNKIAYEFVGTLTADVTVIVPATVQQYWIFENTNVGAFNLSVATQDQADFRTPLPLIRADRVIAYSDGTDVVATQAAAVSGAVNGGTF